MNQETIFNSKNIKTIILITAMVVILSLVFSLVQPGKYKSSAKLLVIFSQENMSPYTSAQTSNYIASILGEVVYSNSFINSVFKTSFEVKDDLGFSQERRLKNWKKMVKTAVQENKGIINIDVYHRDRNQANNLAQAISYILVTNNNQYHGSGDKVTVKMISAPESSEHWATPNIKRNLLLGLVAGIFLSITFVIIFPQQELIGFVFRKNKTKDETINLEQKIAETYHASGEPTSPADHASPTIATDNKKDNYYNW